MSFPAERTSLALHLAAGVTTRGIFFTPRPLALNDQQLRNQDAEVAGTFNPMRAGSSFHEDASA
jgi:hypothetical protein